MVWGLFLSVLRGLRGAGIEPALPQEELVLQLNSLPLALLRGYLPGLKVK